MIDLKYCMFSHNQALQREPKLVILTMHQVAAS